MEEAEEHDHTIRYKSMDYDTGILPVLILGSGLHPEYDIGQNG